MPLPKRRVEYVDTVTDEIIAEYESLNECARATKRPVTMIHKECQGVVTDSRFKARYKSKKEVFLVDTTRAWQCKRHKVWIRNGKPCPLCKLKLKP